MVAIGASIVQMQVATLATTFGVYFAHLTTGPQAMPASLVSTVPSIMVCVSFFFCPISTALSKQYGSRSVALVGAVTVTVSTALSSAIDNFYWFFIFFSLLGGIGSGLILVQGNISVQKYFRTKRATANGVFMSGGAIGNMVMPLILRHLLTLFGFQVTVLIHAAFMATTILAGLTFKPVPVKDKDKDSAEEGQEQSSSCSGGIWFPRLSQIFIWKVLKNPLFIVLTVSVIMGRTGMRGFGMIVPAFGESIGLSKENSTYLITAMSISDFLTRLFLPYLTDMVLPKVPKKYFYICCTFSMGVSLTLFGLIVTDMTTALASSVFFGFTIGGCATFMNIIFVECLGEDNIQDTIGLMYLLTGLWTLPALPILGYLRDATGDYRYSFLGLAGSVMVATAVWALEPFLRQHGSQAGDASTECKGVSQIKPITIAEGQTNKAFNKCES